jgi:IclR family transcriptional regulator, KDG regulon repressor
VDNDDLRYKIFADLGRILSLFESDNGGERSVSDIARAFGMHPSKISRMLRSLEAQGLFERNLDTGRYRIGARFLQMGLLYAMSHPLRSLMFPHVEQMARELKLLSGWGLFKSDRVVIVDRLRYGDDLPMHVLGSDVPLYSTAYGKLFLAHLSPEDEERIVATLDFVRFTHRTIGDKATLKKELVRAKEQGYAFDDEETREHVRGLAAPVFDAHGAVAAAITVAGKTTDISDRKLPDIIKYLTDKAFFMSRQLGYEGRVVARPQRTRTRGRPASKTL